MSKFKKGCTPWNKGRKLNDYPQMGFQKNHAVSKELREKISKLRKKIVGKNHPNWEGGISQNKEYMSWMKNKRNRVIKRLKRAGISHTFGEWELLKKQYGYTCPCCGKSEPEIKLTEDHIIPLSKGGSDYIENIQPLCLHCNFVKHTKTIKY